MLTHSSETRSKQRFSFKPNILTKPSGFADPLILSTLQTLGDKLRDDKYILLAVISTHSESVECAINWILDKMRKSRETPSLKPNITQSKSAASPILVAASPIHSGMRFVDDDLMESVECIESDDDDELLQHSNNHHNNNNNKYKKRSALPPLSIGRSSYNEDDEVITMSATTTITITPTHTHSNYLSNLSRQRSLLSPETFNNDEDAEIIAMSPSIAATYIPYSPTDDDCNNNDESTSSRTPTPPSFEYKYSEVSNTRSTKTTKYASYNLCDLYEDQLTQIIQYLTPKERILCALSSKFMHNLILLEFDKHFNDIWLSFNSLNSSQSLSLKHDHINISMNCIQFIDSEAKSKLKLVDFENIHTRSRSNNNYKIVRFQDLIEKAKEKNHSQKILRNSYLNNLWIWNSIHCLEIGLSFDDIFNCMDWELLCRYKLSKSISFLSLNKLNPDNFHLITKYFPNLEYLNFFNFQFDSKYRDVILEFFKLNCFNCSDASEWAKVESSLVKLRGIEFNITSDLVFSLLSSSLIHNNNTFIFESLFTQLITLSINKCDLSSINDLQIILNSCINVKYLSLCDISIGDLIDSHGSLHSSHSNGSLIDRVQRTKNNRKQSKIMQNNRKAIDIQYLNGVPILKIPKSVKYFKIYHKFSKNNMNFDDDHFTEESEESKTTTEYSRSHTSNQSTPLLFAMDDLSDIHQSPQITSIHRKRSKKFKSKMCEYPSPPFYSNLSKCRKKLITVNCEINDGYLINQLFLNNLKSLKYVIINYSSAEHNGYLNFAEFCQFYQSQYQNWNKKYSKNIKIILNNALYDEYKLSLNKIKCSQFFYQIFNKKENQIIKEEQFNAIMANARNVLKNNTQNVFIEKLIKCTQFFKPRIHHQF